MIGFTPLCSLLFRLSVIDTLLIIICPTAAIHKPDALQQQIFAILVVLPLPNKLLLKGYKQTNKIFKVTFSKFKITIALKTYLPRRDGHKEFSRAIPQKMPHPSPHLSASISNARSGTVARRIFCKTFPSGTRL